MIIDHSQMQDVESGTTAGRGVIADEQSGITVGGIGDGQHVHTVSAPASTAVHVGQSTSAGRQLWRHVGDVIVRWSKSHPLTSSYTRVYNISRVRSGKSSTTNEAKTVQQAGTWKTGEKCEDKKAASNLLIGKLGSCTEPPRSGAFTYSVLLYEKNVSNFWDNRGKQTLY